LIAQLSMPIALHLPATRFVHTGRPMPSIWWSSLAVGLVLGFYWARVIKLVLKAKKRGESANFFPPEPIGRLIRAIWYPTVVVWVLTPLLLAFTRPDVAPLRPLFSNTLVSWLAAGGCVAILALTMICWRKMGREWRMGIDPNEKNNLLVTGPYAYVRHPIYALQRLLAVVSAIAVPVPVMVGVAVIEVVLLSWEAIREEQHLTRVHGQTYQNYMRTAGRFWPKRLRRAPA
jgi:protein-S-isoprenylcysteine O-methyltransferase Ste14